MTSLTKTAYKELHASLKRFSTPQLLSLCRMRIFHIAFLTTFLSSSITLSAPEILSSWSEDLERQSLSPPSFKLSSSKRIKEAFTPSPPAPSKMELVIFEDGRIAPHAATEGFLTSLNINSHQIKGELASLEDLLTVEFSPYRSWLRWKTVDHTLQKTLYYLVLDEEGFVTPDKQKTWSFSKRYWIRGQALPLRSSATMRRGYFVDSFKKGLETALLSPIHLGLPILTLYHFVEYFTPQRHCGYKISTPLSFQDFISNIRSSDDQSIAGFFHSTIGNEAAQALLLSLPALWGTINGTLAAVRGEQSEEEFLEKIKDFKGQKVSLWNDWFSILPFHPLPRRLANLQLQLLWNGTLSSSSRNEAFQALERLLSHSGYTQVLALKAMSHLAYNAHTCDLRFLRNLSAINSEDTILWLSLKNQALQHIQKHTPFHKDDKRAWFMALYARYLLWSLGLPSSRLEGVSWTIFKGAKLWGQARLINLVVQNALEAFQCPQPGNFKITGPTEASGKFTETCLRAYLSNFGKIPEQSPTAITNHLTQFYIPNCTYAIDLSNRKLSEDQVGLIVRSFVLDQPKVVLQSLFLSGNFLGSSSFFENTLSLLTGLQVLDLSNNAIVGGGIALGQSLSFLTNLQRLNLSQNSIGYFPQPFGENLSFLTNLQDLDLSNNNFDYPSFPYPGAQALGQSLAFLTNLRQLDLSVNQITSGLLQSLVFLTNLQMLNLSDSQIGSQAPWQNLAFLSNLQCLDLSYNGIGNGFGSFGTQALGRALAFLTNLRYLDLSNNWIGSWDSKGTQDLGQGLASLTKLQFLDLSVNNIGSTDMEGIRSLCMGIQQLYHLNYFGFFPQQDTSSQPFILINQALRNASLVTPYPLVTVADVETYFRALSPSTSYVSLRNQLALDPTTLELLIQKLATLTNLQQLDLSQNNIGWVNSNSTIALGQRLASLTKLQFLDLSGNYIGYTDSAGTQALGKALSSLKDLQSLKLAGNSIGYTDSAGTQALGQGLASLTKLQSLELGLNNIGFTGSAGTQALGQRLASLTKLQFLDLSFNNIGFNGSAGTQALGKALSSLKDLQSLRLAGNSIDSTDSIGIQALGQGLASLTKLQSLDLSLNQISFTDSAGTQDLEQGLASLTKLQFLDLSGNYIGFTDSAGTQALGQGLASLTKLQSLNLSGNYIGYTDSAGTQALGKALSSLKDLQSLKLSGNFIGSTDLEGPKAVLTSLLSLPKLQTLDLGYNGFHLGMQNVTLSINSLDSLACAYRQELTTACQQGLCFGVQGNVSERAFSKIPPALPIILEQLAHGQISYASGHAISISDETCISSASRTASPFWLPSTKSIWKGGGFIWRNLLSKGDQILDALTHRVATYACSVVDSCPSYFPNATLLESPYETQSLLEHKLCPIPSLTYGVLHDSSHKQPLLAY